MKSVQRIRYPPFDHDNISPASVPMTEVVVSSSSPPPTQFRIGTEDGWLVEWRDLSADDEDLPHIDSVTTTATLPFLMRTRNGWYIDPDPLHGMARRLIAPTVIILILSLFLHAIAPALTGIPILSWLTEGSYKVGPLDYPKLLIFTFPVFTLPIVLRMIANSRDFRRQNAYIANPLKEPEIDFSVGDGEIVLRRLRLPDGIRVRRIRLQVGLAVPERAALLRALGRPDNGQPPPGMSTPLPARRITTGEEHGTGVGEATPIPIAHNRVLMLEPMRVQSTGEWMDLDSANQSELVIKGPEERWPGSIYSSLIAMHWELVIDARRGDTEMFWVKPVVMGQSEEPVLIEEMPVRSSRSEIKSD